MGTPILLLHDAIDIILFFGKAALDVGQKTVANILFVFFVLGYFILRLVIFGKILLRCIFMSIQDTEERLGSSRYFVGYRENVSEGFEFSAAGFCINKYCVAPYNTLVFSACILYIMHIYWFALILRMVKKAVTKGSVDKDIRETNDAKADE